MTREIERVAGIPVVHIATIVPIMETVGSNRIVPGVAIPYPMGAPVSDDSKGHVQRRELLMRAITAMQTPITEQTVFE